MVSGCDYCRDWLAQVNTKTSMAPNLTGFLQPTNFLPVDPLDAFSKGETRAIGAWHCGIAGGVRGSPLHTGIGV